MGLDEISHDSLVVDDLLTTSKISPWKFNPELLSPTGTTILWAAYAIENVCHLSTYKDRTLNVKHHLYLNLG